VTLATSLFGKIFEVVSGLSLGKRVSNLKSVALTVLELLAFNSHWSAAHTQTDKQTDRHTSNEHIISAIHFVHLAEIITQSSSKNENKTIVDNRCKKIANNTAWSKFMAQGYTDEVKAYTKSRLYEWRPAHL